MEISEYQWFALSTDSENVTHPVIMGAMQIVGGIKLAVKLAFALLSYNTNFRPAYFYRQPHLILGF